VHVRTAYGDPLEKKYHTTGVKSVTPHTSEAPRDIADLGRILMVELGACLRMITSDVARAAELDEARTRWVRRLMALAALADQGVEKYDSGYERPDLGHRSISPGTSNLRSLKLTTCEREIVVLTQKGYPPRKIARRLQLSVQTVYTHLRNARRKQRLLESPTSV
jgi:DNA-binding CsgD family transcriptional regulator